MLQDQEQQSLLWEGLILRRLLADTYFPLGWPNSREYVQLQIRVGQTLRRLRGRLGDRMTRCSLLGDGLRSVLQLSALSVHLERFQLHLYLDHVHRLLLDNVVRRLCSHLYEW